MGWVFAFLTVIFLIFAWIEYRLVRLERNARKDLSLLNSDPVSFYEKWHRRYRKARLPAEKQFTLFLNALALHRQGKEDAALDRIRFVKRGGIAGANAVNALREAILRGAGQKDRADTFYRENRISVDAGRGSPWLQ